MTSIVTGVARSALSIVILGTACAGSPRAFTAPAPHAQPADVESVVYLIGDAGNPAPAGEPVLRALARDLGRTGAPSVVVYLGDNIYPRGLPAAGAGGRADAERRLRTQVNVVLRGRATGILVPGNHDWAKSGAGGWDAIRRQDRFIERVGRGRVVMLPGGGCPGPAVRDVGRGLRIVALDTQWWLQRAPRPGGGNSTCPASREEAVVDSLAAALDAAGSRRVVVVAHHPLESGGPHGGHFPWEDHLFPLRALRRWLWVPLPLLGALYPAARRAGISQQDIAGERNRRMRRGFARAFARHPPLLYASGHDHSLQVLEATNPKYLLVSGAGIYGHTSHTSRLPATLFAAPGESGYVRLDVLRDRRVRLGVITVDAGGRASERFSMYLD